MSLASLFTHFSNIYGAHHLTWALKITHNMNVGSEGAAAKTTPQKTGETIVLKEGRSLIVHHPEKGREAIGNAD
jgi:hypothetical protein